MPRMLLLGKDGQLGRALGRAAWLGGDRVALGRAECDLTDEIALAAMLRDAAPDIILNAAAYTAVDQAEDEPERAFAVNAAAPAVLARYAAQSNAVLIHFSTDYVFDGSKSGAHEEADPTAPLGVYGETKLAGERAVAASGCRHIIVRTSWVYSAEGSNFPRTMLRLARQRPSLSVVADQWGAPTSVDLLSDVTGRFVERLRAAGAAPQARDPLFGLYHCAAAGRTNWCDYARYFLTCCAAAGIALTLDPADIQAIAGEAYPTKAQRPKNSLLSSAKLEQTLALSMPDWRSGVRALAAELANIHRANTQGTENP